MKYDDLNDLDNMIKDGNILASCPNCKQFIETVYVKKCTSCNCKIDINKISLVVADWSNAN